MIFNKNIIHAIWGMLFCSAMAQAAGLPGTALPGQIEKQFQKPPEMRATEPSQVVVPEAAAMLTMARSQPGQILAAIFFSASS